MFAEVVLLPAGFSAVEDCTLRLCESLLIGRGEAIPKTAFFEFFHYNWAVELAASFFYVAYWCQLSWWVLHAPQKFIAVNVAPNITSVLVLIDYHLKNFLRLGLVKHA